MSEDLQKTTPHRAVLVVVFATILIDFVGFSVLIPVLPHYAEQLGATPFQVGLVLACYALTQLLFLPMWGWISDRIGRRPVLLLSLLGTTGSFLLLAFAPSLFWVYIARIAAGFFAASIGTAQAVVTDITDAQERASGMGLIGSAFGVGLILGPVLGGGLAQISVSAPFVGVAILAGISLILAWSYLPETRSGNQRTPRWGELGQALIPAPVLLVFEVHDRRIAIYLVLFFIFFTSFAVLEAMATLFMAYRFGKDAVDAALFFAWVGLFLVLTQGILLQRLVQIAGESRLLMIGLALMAIGIASISIVPNYPSLFVIGALIAIGQGIAFPPFTSLFSKACRAEQAGELLGQSNAMATLGRVIGSLAGGWALEHHLSLPFLASGSLMFLGLVGFSFFRRQLVQGLEQPNIGSSHAKTRSFRR